MGRADTIYKRYTSTFNAEKTPVPCPVPGFACPGKPRPEIVAPGKRGKKSTGYFGKIIEKFMKIYQKFKKM